VVIKLDSSGSYQWHSFYGASGSDVGQDIVVDNSGNLYVVGASNATWQGDGGANPLNAHNGSGMEDVVVLKLNSSGAYQWHTFSGSIYAEFGYGIALDGNNNIYVTGWGENAGPGDILVLKLNSNGAYQWSAYYGDPTSSDQGYSIALDENQNIYIAGNSYATWQGDGNANPLHAHAGGGPADIVVLKLSNGGAYQWHTFYGSISNDVSSRITTDGNGNVYITGYSLDSWQGDDDTNPLHAYTGDGLADVTVLRLNSSGVYQWHTFYGSNDADISKGIAADGNGGVFVTGYSSDSWQGDGNTNPLHAHAGGGLADIIVLKLNSSGVYQWHTFYGSSSSDFGQAIAVDEDGYIHVTANSNATWQADGGTNPLHGHSGGSDITVMRIADYR